MTKCTICWAWQPTEWDGSKGHWSDTTAKCQVKNKFTTAGESCESGAIVKPKVYSVTKPVSHKTPVKESVPVEASVFKFTGELYAHQKEAIEMFKDSNEICLFMEVGTGKSATVLRIAGYKFKKGEINALLIVAPNGLHVQWAHEQLPLWLDAPFECQCLFGNGGQKAAYGFDDDDPETLKVVCVNIDTFSTPQKWKDVVEWSNSNKTMIVLDEATTIKSVNAQRTQRMLYAFNDVIMRKKKILASTRKSVARAILTGTPVTNGPMDMWALMEFIRPDYFGRNWYSFRAHFGMFSTIEVNGRSIAVPITEEVWHAIKSMFQYEEASAVFGVSLDTYNYIHAQEAYEGPYKHADELKELIVPVSYFKRLVDCVDMPKQNYIIKDIPMTPDIEQCYNDMVTELITEYEGHVASAKSNLTALIRLQQISSGFICDKTFGQDDDVEPKEEDAVSRMFGLTEDEDIMPNEIQWIGTSNPKLDALYRDVDECAKPLIIATRFSAEAARIYDDLQGKYRCCLMTGWKRVGTIEEYQAGNYDIMVANTAVMARGFNLQNGHVILKYSRTFSLELDLQLDGRIFRIGQQQPCEYISYSYTDTIDEKINSALDMKRNLLDYIRGAELKEFV